MSAEPKPVTVKIMGKEYCIACPPEEKEGLEASARYLDEKMTEIRDRGRTASSDNIAIMAALNITHELLQKDNHSQRNDNSISTKVKTIQNKIEAALSSARQIEI